MEARFLYFTVHSASNLVDVRKFGDMKVYSKVSIAGKSECTEVDLVNGTNPKWNTTFSFIVPEKNIIHSQGKISVKIELICRRSLSRDKYVGEVNISLDSLRAKSCNTCLVDRNDTNFKSSNFGTLMYSSVLGDKFIFVNSSSSEDYTNKVNKANIGATLISAVATVATGVATILTGS